MIDLERFFDKVICSDLFGQFLQFGVSRKVDNRNHAKIGMPFQCVDRILSANNRHFMINKNEIRLKPTDLFDKIVKRIAPSQCENTKIASFEYELTDQQVIWIIIDDKDFFGKHFFSLRH